MGVTTRDKIQFVHAMARHTRASVRQCEALLRYAGTLRRLECVSDRAGWDKRDRIQRKVTELCGEIEGFTGRESDTCTCGIQRNQHGRMKHPFTPVWESGKCVPMFAGAVLKIRVPDGGEVVVPS